jgi:hypothetical protein
MIESIRAHAAVGRSGRAPRIGKVGQDHAAIGWVWLYAG